MSKTSSQKDSHAQTRTPCLHCQRITHGQFCCNGCEQVYFYIKSKGLSRYYLLRDHMDAAISSPIMENTDETSSTLTTIAPFIWKEKALSTVFAVYVPTLSCAACLWLIRAALGKLPHVVGIDVNFDEKLVLVEARSTEGEGRTKEQNLFLHSLLHALMCIGYRSYPPGVNSRDDAHHLRWRKTMIDLAISGAVFGNVMLFAAAVYLGRNPTEMSYLGGNVSAWVIETKFRLFFDISAAALTTISLVLVGRRFFVNAWNAMRLRTLHIDQPIALALALAYTVSIHNLWVGSPLLYFDSITGLIFLLLVARAASEMLTERAKRLADSAISAIPSSNVAAGEIYEVAPGDVFVADGVIATGTGEVSETALSGESTPILKKAGDRVLAGSQNLVSALTVQATASAGDSYVQQIRKIIAEAIKPTLTPAMDRVLRWFVTGIYVATALAVFLWWQSDFSVVAEVVCAVLIVSCPCALALAVPLARSFALKRAWHHGVIVKTADAFETMGKVDTIVIDKTGTLTTGVVDIDQITAGRLIDFAEWERKALRQLARRSRHPVSQAVAIMLSRTVQDDSEDEDLWTLSDIRETPGLGISALCTFRAKTFMLKIGRGSFVDPSANKNSFPGFSVGVALQQHANPPKTLLFSASDPLRSDSLAVVRKWQAQGLDVRILSGDLKAHVAKVANELNVAIWKAQVLPDEKQHYVDDLVTSGKVVAMVGDGVNDACALASAHVGIAVKGGADLALASADLFLSREGLGVVDEALDYAKFTHTTQNIVMGFGIAYNVVAISLALAGVLHPLAAALIMPLSSVSVIAIAYFRKGTSLWKSSMSSCLLRSPSSV